MAFGTPHNNELKTFVNIFGGQLAVNVKEGDEDAISRVNKKEKTVWEKYYPDLNGILESIEVRKNDFLKAWEYVVHVSDMGMHYYISIPTDSRYGDNFARKVPNLKFATDFTIKPYDFEDKESGKKRTGISLMQNGVKIEAFYTMDNPQGMPMLTEKVEEELYKIHTIQLNKFLREAVEKHCKPKDVSAENVTPPVTNTADGNDSLPF